MGTLSQNNEILSLMGQQPSMLYLTAPLGPSGNDEVGKVLLQVMVRTYPAGGGEIGFQPVSVNLSGEKKEAQFSDKARETAVDFINKQTPEIVEALRIASTPAT